MPNEQELLDCWSEQHQDPRDYVVSKFEEAKWVFLGEYHRVKHDVELVLSLIPALHEQTKVRHLALEFLVRDRTDEANALVTAREYDRRRILAFFREQFAGWPYEEYLDIFRTTWESNQKLAEKQGPFLLVGLHPGIDWETVHYGEEAAAELEREKQSRYDEIMAEALEESLLRTGKPALVFTGVAHATAKFTEYWVGTTEALPRMGNMVYREPYRDEMFFVCLHAPFYDAAADQDIYPFDGMLDRLMLRYGDAIGFDVVGTPFEHLAHAIRSPTSITRYTFGELYDGYILSAIPIKQYTGVTCIEDWITSEEEFRFYWRHLTNRKASERVSEMPLEEFRRDFCAPRPDFGAEFARRFRHLPDLD